MSELTINDLASKHLGQNGSYAVYTEQFDPTLLVPMPRELARKDWGIKGNEFVGVDTWHCHEATFLLNNGLPLAGTLKIVYSSESEFMVESKSIKLYINSFDMCKMGATVEQAIVNYEAQVKKDLSELLKTNVEVFFHKNNSDKTNSSDPGETYKDIYEYLSSYELEELSITDYSAKEKHLIFNEDKSNDGKDVINQYRLSTNVLRSRCRHTKQKDTGSAFIYILTKNATLDIKSLLKEIISLREVNEFHEFCSEKLFVELKSHKEVIDCCVMLLYSRRGSWDICPARSTSLEMIPKVLKDASIYTTKQMGQ